MRIRAQLAWLMVAIVAPIVVLAAASTYALYETQREVHSQRYLERVRALRLALDSELRGAERMLQVFSARSALAAAQPPAAAMLDEALPRLLGQQPMWGAIAVVEIDGRSVASATRPGWNVALPLDEATRTRVVETRQPAVSNLIAVADGGPYVVFVAVPVLAGGRVTRVVAAAIDHRQWLAFLRSYPIAPDATLTLNDAQGVIIARTLNPERWAGQRSRADYWERVVNGPHEAAFMNQGLEGQQFYSAYSRLEAAPWTLGTGVPASTVEAALRRQTTVIAGGVLLAALLAAGGAWVLGRRITGALTRLADLSTQGEPGAGPPLAIDEAETARQRLHETLQAQQRARREAEVARAQAEAANRGKDEFVAVLAHELRNPLSAISTSVAVLEAAGGATPMQRRAQDALKRQVHQMSRLVEDLLDAARMRSGKLGLRLEDIDLAGVVPSVLQAFHDAGRTVHLDVQVQLEPAVVRGDPVRLEQIVANLIDNAAKFTSQGRLTVRLRCEDGQAVLRVQDDGVGITAALLPHLFDPYTQGEPEPEGDAGAVDTQARRAGLGLGLHVVKRLVELHGGRIEAHSEGDGRGACFTVRLPLSPDMPA